MADKWIVPCNIKYFDVITHFRKTNQVVWKNSFTMREGDIAYIYIGSPIREIRYRCKVISTSVDESILEANSYAIPTKTDNNYFSKKIKYVIMELEYEFPASHLRYEDLKANGLGQVQIQARTDRKLQHYIDAVESELLAREDRNGG